MHRSYMSMFGTLATFSQSGMVAREIHVCCCFLGRAEDVDLGLSRSRGGGGGGGPSASCRPKTKFAQGLRHILPNLLRQVKVNFIRKVPGIPWLPGFGRKHGRLADRVHAGNVLDVAFLSFHARTTLQQDCRHLQLHNLDSLELPAASSVADSVHTRIPWPTTSPRRMCRTTCA